MSGMTFAEFEASLCEDSPPANLSGLLLALWYDAQGDWDKAHDIAQDVKGRSAARVHAYLHRKEGDLGNAAYWYTRAGVQECQTSLAEEWQALVSAFIS